MIGGTTYNWNFHLKETYRADKSHNGDMQQIAVQKFNIISWISVRKGYHSRADES